MGIFKDLFRDIAESKMTERDLQIKWAQEKEAGRDWSRAGYHYEQAKEWEKAGDTYLQGWKKKEGGYEFDGPKNASRCYWEAKNYHKMREAYQECLWTNVWDPEFTNDCVRRLTATHQMDAFTKQIIQNLSDYDPDKAKERLFHHELVRGLNTAGLRTCAAELLRHFPKSLRYERRDVIRGLIVAGKIQEGLDLTRFLTGQKALDTHDYQKIAKMFADEKAYNAAGEVSLGWFGVDPHDAVYFGRAFLIEIGEWEAFLTNALERNPLELGKQLSLLFLGRTMKGGELEADILLRCYDSVGPKPIDGVVDKDTTEWLPRLADFWKEKGATDKEADLRSRYLQDKERAGGKGSVARPDYHDYIEAAYSLGDKRDFTRAAEAME